jgi:plastocyanin
MRPFAALSLLAGLASLAATAACSSDNNNGGVTRDVTIVSGASTKGAAAFSPNPFTESAATRSEVIWANDDGTTHRVVSDAPLFDSGNLGNGGTFTFNFTAPGTYTYHCSIHPTMVGTITIDP